MNICHQSSSILSVEKLYLVALYMAAADALNDYVHVSILKADRRVLVKGNMFSVIFAASDILTCFCVGKICMCISLFRKL